MKKLAQGFNTAAHDLKHGSRSRESEALPLNHCALVSTLLSNVGSIIAAESLNPSSKHTIVKRRFHYCS